MSTSFFQPGLRRKATLDVEPTGRMANPDLLGPRGMGGIRTTPKGLLPGIDPHYWGPDKTPTAYRPPTPLNADTAISSAPARETRLSDYTPDELENAHLLVRQTIDMMQSGDELP